MKRLSPVTAITLAMGWVGMGILPASAQDCPPPQHRLHQPERGPLCEEGILKLSEAQKASLQAIRAKHEESLAAKRKAAQAAHAAFAQAEQKPETRPETLKSLHRTLADQSFEARLEHRAMKEEIRAILTPEQREQSARMEGRREGLWMAHRGGMAEKGMQHEGHPDLPGCEKGKTAEQ